MTEPPAEPTDTPPAAPAAGTDTAYRVLARKYRPSTFEELIGQQAMVRTLTNAIAAGRLAHAFILTGVRGIGKTTTARLIARALNCTGVEGGGPTIQPCGTCENCRAIAQDRHVDVMEMDAASRTGVDDIREIIEGVRYRPTSARYKIYIIDEVHMLSRNAFNALLKTLEEPPEHVKFIFATTEIRKVPITVLSRCQRFDLRRVDQSLLAGHFRSVAEREGAQVSDEALALVARAADGSVRDGLSLLDQAIAHCAGTVDAAQVRDMLGLADRARTFDLFDLVMKGEVAAALDDLGDQYRAGADPLVVLQDLLDLVHWLTRIKVAPAAADDAAVAETERERGKAMATGLPVAALTRAWQMLLKGLQETQFAPSPLQAAEMVLIRLAYATELPSPADAVKALKDGSEPATTPRGAPGDPHSGGGGGGGGVRAVAGGRPSGSVPGGQPAPAEPRARQGADPRTFQDVVALTDAMNERILHANLVNTVHLVHFEPGRIEFHPADSAPSSLANDLSSFLRTATGRPWMVSLSQAPGEATLRQKDDAAKAARLAEAANHPLARAVLDAFPGAKVIDVRDLEDTTAGATADDAPLPTDPDETAQGDDDA